MWTCSKCGEQIEDQFDSCWKCAGPTEVVAQSSDYSEQKLKWFHYIVAALASYLAAGSVVFAVFVFSAQTLALRNLKIDFSPLEFWLWVVGPGTVTFLILLPFLRFRLMRRIVFVCAWLGWLILCTILLTPAKTRAI